MRLAILLSHHGEDQLDRCISVGRVRLCARCLGLYPALCAALALRLAAIVGGDGWDEVVLLGAAAVGVAAWGMDRGGTRWGGSGVRVVAGAVLGVGIGWMLALHFREPFAPLVVGQMAMIVALWAGFEIWGAHRIDRTGARTVCKACDGREGRPDEAPET